jgi:hypothetical protein
MGQRKRKQGRAARQAEACRIMSATSANMSTDATKALSSAVKPKAGNGTGDNASTKASGSKKPGPKAKGKTGTHVGATQPEGWNLGRWARDILDELSAHVSDEEAILLQSQAEVVDRLTVPAVAAPDPTKPTLVRTQASLRALAKKLEVAPEVVVDLETSDLDPRKGEIVGIGLALPDGPIYIPIGHRLEEDRSLRPYQLPLVSVLTALRLKEKHLIGHNSKFDFKWLKHHGNISCRYVWDAMIAARLLHSDLPADLKTLAGRELDVPDWGLSKAEIKRLQFLPIELVAAYCAKDCWYTLLLYRRQLACLV